MHSRGLKLKLKKCTFLAGSLQYLSHVIDSSGLHPAPGKVEAVVSAPKLAYVKELQSYLALLNFYRRFLPNVISAPITERAA